MDKTTITRLRRRIFAWYKQFGRHDLPWRKTTDLYHTAVAEIMLQQTNVPKVIEKYQQFIARFPTLIDLAQARQKDVMMHWQGLGYNRRAIYLHKMAQYVANEHDGIFPKDPNTLITLPGIGPYTSRSILIFARNRQIATWDVNIARVFRRWHGKKEADEKKIEKWCDDLLPSRRSRDWHNALNHAVFISLSFDDLT
jgi:A/G-specific adenine glycosylase